MNWPFWNHSKKGVRITSEDVAMEWVAMVPFGWSAEEIALKNIAAGILPPKSGWFNNPYREWIGAQMRGAICGWSPRGMPKKLLDWPLSMRLFPIITTVSLGNLQRGSRFVGFCQYRCPLFIRKSHSSHPFSFGISFGGGGSLWGLLFGSDWESAWKTLEPRFQRYNWIHSYPNAAAEVVALWFGNGDFDETMHIIGMIGYDVDCNAAQIMTALGIINDTVPAHWAQPLGEEIFTYCRGLKRMTVRELAEETVLACQTALHK
jgi:hypothetical protein